MKASITTKWKTTLGRVAMSFVAIAALTFLVTYETAKPLAARAATAAPAAAALDDNSVGALLSLDHAMETLAARVPPPIVTVAVTSKSKPDSAEQQLPDDLQQFFGPGFGQFFGPRGRPQQPQIEHGIGSGVIISPDGYIVTNNHVVDGAMEVRVTLHDRRSFPAKVIGTDKLTDLAVVKIDAKDLPTVGWGDSTKLVPGQSVLAIGNPFGQFQFSVTRGI